MFFRENAPAEPDKIKSTEPPPSALRTITRILIAESTSRCSARPAIIVLEPEKSRSVEPSVAAGSILHVWDAWNRAPDESRRIRTLLSQIGAWAIASSWTPHQRDPTNPPQNWGL